ncbi:hypothetical protein [Marinicella litoralis]|uniref:Tetratricopeptide repeat protein n=1 Tax=Marinicella litoralis TaxID=644220 RepID=A0A4R6XI13_9GAMM|nr:hypothetical protein [Marinicella litoralis]TDR17464.1 tetratricopeptide repeat protein [Marinicella litoralis]
MKYILSLCVLLFATTAIQASISCADAITGGDYIEALPICESEVEKSASTEGLGQADIIDNWLHLVEIHHELGHTEQESYYLAKIKSHSLFVEHIEYQYQWNRRVGQKYYFLGDYLKADKYLQHGLSLAENEHNPLWLSKSFNDVGLTAYKLNDYVNSLNYFKKSLTLKLTYGDAYQVGKTLNNIALVHMDLEDHALAVDFYEQALNQYLNYAQQPTFDERVYQQISHIYEDLSKAHSKIGNATEAQKYAQKIVATFKLKNSPRAQARAMINIGKYHLGLKQYASAQLFFDEAAAIHQDNDIELGLEYYLDAASVKFQNGLVNPAIELAQNGLSQAMTSADSNQVSQFYGLLSRFFRSTDLAKAYEYLQLQQASREQFLKEKYDEDLNNIKHQIEKQKIQHDLINEQLINANKSAKLQQLTHTILIGIIGFLILAIVLFAYFLNKRKERKVLMQSIKHHKQQLFLMQNQSPHLNYENTPVSAAALKQEFKVNLVSTLLDALAIWEKTTGSDRVELAEKSKVWTISIDNGTLRTRSLDKYLDVDKIPENPRWRNVVKTCHFILTCDDLSQEDRCSLEQRLDALLDQIKQFSLASNKE